MAEAKLSDGRHCSFLHAVEQIRKVAVKVVIHLEGGYGWVSEQYAAGTAEHVNKSAVVQRKQRVENVEDGSFVAHPRYRGFYGDHLTFVTVQSPHKRKKDGSNRHGAIDTVLILIDQDRSCLCVRAVPSAYGFPVRSIRCG